MRTAKLSLVFCLLCSCSTPRADSACPEPLAAKSVPDAMTLDAELLEIATSATTLHRLELRVDGSGSVVKQAVYHDARGAIPEPVFAIAEREFPGAQIDHYESERYADLGAVHEIELKTADGRECEIAGRADGTLLYTECDIDPASLPEPVTAAVATTLPEATIVAAKQKRVVGADTRFVVEVSVQGRVLALQLTPDGSLLAKHLRVPAYIEVQLTE